VARQDWGVTRDQNGTLDAEPQYFISVGMQLQNAILVIGLTMLDSSDSALRSLMGGLSIKLNVTRRTVALPQLIKLRWTEHPHQLITPYRITVCFVKLSPHSSQLQAAYESSASHNTILIPSYYESSAHAAGSHSTA
jgi:hypothetical protein